MPKIAEFEAGSGRIQPSETGIEANVQAGRRIGLYFHQIGEDTSQDIRDNGQMYQDQVFRQQVTHAEAVKAQGWASLTTDWNTTAKAADPNDPTTADKWRQDKLEPWLKQWAAGFTTEKGQIYAAEQSAEIRQHFTEMTLGDQGRLAGIAAKQNVNDASNGFGAAARADGTVRGIQTIMGSFEQGQGAVVDSHSNLTAEDAANVKASIHSQGKSYIAMQGLEGMIESGPNGIAAARKAIADGTFSDVLGHDEVQHLTDLADHTEERNATMQRQQDEVNRQSQEDAGRAAYANISHQIDELGRSGKPIPPALVKAADQWRQTYAGLLPTESTNLDTGMDRNIEDRNSFKYQQDNPAVSDNLFRRIGAGPHTPGYPTVTELDKAYFTDKTISTDTWERARKSVSDAPHDPVYEGALKQLDQWFSEGVRPQITRSPQAALGADGEDMPTTAGPGQTDPNGFAAAAEARRAMHQVFDHYVASGTNPNDAVKAMMDPHNPTSFANAVAYYQQAAHSGQPYAYFNQHPVMGARGSNAWAGGTDIQPQVDQAAARLMPGSH